MCVSCFRWSPAGAGAGWRGRGRRPLGRELRGSLAASAAAEPAGAAAQQVDDVAAAGAVHDYALEGAQQKSRN